MKISITWWSNLVKMNITDSISTSRRNVLMPRRLSVNKTKGTLLQELQPKYDTFWMGYWTGKILTSHHSKFRFGIYCLFLRLSWRKISRYSVLEKVVCFHLWEEYDLMCASVEEIFQDMPFWKSLSSLE